MLLGFSKAELRELRWECVHFDAFGREFSTGPRFGRDAVYDRVIDCEIHDRNMQYNDPRCHRCVSDSTGTGVKEKWVTPRLPPPGSPTPG